ncbi:MAG: permease-like cell division protein FtsX [Lachnospiraceae bacterium]|nr:permease-like cell division protein FtsX [Lachnospiraceae bacterium]
MRISTLLYTIKQGLKNIFRNKVFSLATVATIAACVFLFSLFYSVIVNFQNMVMKAQAGVAVTVFFDEGISDERIQEIGDLIKQRVEVSNIEFISADEAWDSFKEEYLGEYVDTFGDDNPLEDCASYEIYLNDVSMQDSLVKYLETVDGISKVNQSAMAATMLSSMNSLIAYVSLAIILILFLVSVFLISNTVAMGITVRREEIAIMKLIGATDFVVRAPFVIEGLILGLFGAALPLIAVYFVYNRVIGYMRERFEALASLLQFLTVQEVFVTLVPVALIMGAGIGLIGSYFTVRKNLRV